MQPPGTPLARKLGFKPDLRICCLNQPPEYRSFFDVLPDGIQWVQNPETGMDIIHYFEVSRDRLAANLPWLRDLIVTNGMIWVSWPKKSSGRKSDVTEDVIRDLALAHRLVDVKVVSVNAIWSGLKLVIPLKYR